MKQILEVLNGFVVCLCQFLAIFFITVGIVKSLVVYLKDALFGIRSVEAIRESRMELGHAFSLSLGFLIGASILKTTIDPGWNVIGQLAAIIIIRTGLNYFLLRDISAHTSEAIVKSFHGDIKGAMKQNNDGADPDSS